MFIFDPLNMNKDYNEFVKILVFVKILSQGRRKKDGRKILILRNFYSC